MRWRVKQKPMPFAGEYKHEMWFAWHPVQCGEQMVWLEWVRRTWQFDWLGWRVVRYATLQTPAESKGAKDE